MSQINGPCPAPCLGKHTDEGDHLTRDGVLRVYVPRRTAASCCGVGEGVEHRLGCPAAFMARLHDDFETRMTDPLSGGQKGVKATQLGALDPAALIELARVAGYGAAKYEAFNYLKGYDWSFSFNAAQRHALLFWAGEDVDQESGRLHVAMAAWHFLALVSFMLRGIGTDSRFRQDDRADQIVSG